MPTTRMEYAQIERLASTNTAELMEEEGGVSVARAFDDHYAKNKMKYQN